MTIKLRDDLELDEELSLKEAHEYLENKGVRANISIDKMIILDCADPPDTFSGYKLIFNDIYPDGKLQEVLEYRFKHELGVAELIGTKWKRSDIELNTYC